MISPDVQLTSLAGKLGAALRARGACVAIVESCTGGWVAKAITDVPGSSEWFGWGWVTYSNEAKLRLVGVPGELLAVHGAVSGEVVEAMARGARHLSGAEFAVAVSGVAGPGGGTTRTPVGTVWFAWAGPWDARQDDLAGRADDGALESAARRAPGMIGRRVFCGDREAIRRQTVAHALTGLLTRLGRDSRVVGDTPVGSGGESG